MTRRNHAVYLSAAYLRIQIIRIYIFTLYISEIFFVIHNQNFFVINTNSSFFVTALHHRILQVSKRLRPAVHEFMDLGQFRRIKGNREILTGHTCRRCRKANKFIVGFSSVQGINDAGLEGIAGT